MEFELIIAGGGPAGVAAGVYAARKKIKSLIIADSIGGQSIVSSNIKNWIGTPKISGRELANNLEIHLRSYEGANFKIATGEKINTIEKTNNGFVITTTKDRQYTTKTVLISTGGRRRKLEVPGADQFEHKGLTYCASCDGPMFADKKTIVIGGGNAGFESASQLLAYAKSVTLLENTPAFKADKITVDKTLADPKMTAMANVEIVEIKGDKFVSSLIYRDKTDNQIKELPVDGIFVEIGFLPNTEMIKDLVATNSFGSIVIDHKTGQTNQEGIWAAGDCTDCLYHQNNIAAGDAVKALEDIYIWLRLK
jgi:NADH-dependent peroxiredoxin subunit F